MVKCTLPCPFPWLPAPAATAGMGRDEAGSAWAGRGKVGQGGASRLDERNATLSIYRERNVSVFVSIVL